MPYKEKPIEKVYFSIGEVAEQTGLNPSLLRYWETEFEKYLQPKKNSKGVRMYTKKDLGRIEEIRHLVKDRGFTLQGARDYLQAKIKETLPEVHENKETTVGTLHKLRQFLTQLQASLDG
jgi:DNA-binding transcriptional MerR regulator